MQKFELNQHIEKMMSLPVDSLVEYFLRNECTFYESMLAAHIITRKGYRFSAPEQLEELKTKIARWNSWYEYQWPLANMLANQGYVFTLEEILDMGNPSMTGQDTVAHQMATYSECQIDSYRNLLQNSAYTSKNLNILSVEAWKGHTFSMQELEILGNPTIANEMARVGHFFSVDEILRLGNPIRDLHSISERMMRNGYQFSPSELARLNIQPMPERNFTYDHDFYLLFENGRPYFLNSNKSASRIMVEYVMDLRDFFPKDNYFLLYLAQDETGWSLKLGESGDYRETAYLIEKMVVLELVDVLKNALQAQQPLEFGSFHHYLSQHAPPETMGSLEIVDDADWEKNSWDYAIEEPSQ